MPTFGTSDTPLSGITWTWAEIFSVTPSRISGGTGEVAWAGAGPPVGAGGAWAASGAEAKRAAALSPAQQAIDTRACMEGPPASLRRSRTGSFDRRVCGGVVRTRGESRGLR